MSDRNHQLISVRPRLNLETEFSSPTERFMHQTLRPVLKYQNKCVLKLIENHPLYSKIRFQATYHENRQLLKVFVDKQNNLKNTLIGVVVGLMSEDELQFYLENQSGINKRILDMCVTRFASQRFEKC